MELMMKRHVVVQPDETAGILRRRPADPCAAPLA